MVNSIDIFSYCKVNFKQELVLARKNSKAPSDVMKLITANYSYIL